MARPREFDETEAMNSAVAVFHAKGYGASSLIDLLSAMKLSKSSLYNSFGTKHELFLSALDHYTHMNEKNLETLIQGKSTAREKLEAILTALVTASNEADNRGCFLHNSAIEVLPGDDLALEKIRHGLARFKEFYINIIQDGQAKGEISDRHDADTIADFLLSFILGFRSFSRAVNDEARLKNLVKMAMDTVC